MELNEFLSRLKSNPIDTLWNKKTANTEIPPVLANNSLIVKYYSKAASILSDTKKEELQNLALLDAVKIIYGSNYKDASIRRNIIKNELINRLNDN